MILVDDQPIDIVYFKDFTFNGHVISFILPNNDHMIGDIPMEQEIVKPSIISPEPVPALDSWNAPLKTKNDLCFTNLFYYPQEGDRSLQFLKSIRCKWSELMSEVESLFENNPNLGTFGKSAGALTVAGNVSVLEPLEKFFSSTDSYRKAKVLTILVLPITCFCLVTLTLGKTIIATKYIPRIPKDIIYRCNLATSSQGYNYNLRQILKTCMNGGVPVDILKDAKISKNSQGDFFETKDFDRIFLLFGTAGPIPADLFDQLKNCITDSKNYLLLSSSETTLRTVLWDSSIKEMFREGYGYEGRTKPFRYESEWSSKKLFPKLNLCISDIAIIFQLPREIKEYPIAIFEVSKEDFDSENLHKNLSKVLALISMSCIKLANEMVKLRKRPEEARTFGVLIGRGKIQFLDAHPIITEFEKDGKTLHEIHCNVSSSDHWIFDISKPSRTEDDNDNGDICCKSERFRKGQFDNCIKGALNLNDYQFLSEESVRSLGDIVLDDPTEINPTAQEQVDPTEKMFKGEFNEDVLKKLYFFSECLKERSRFYRF